MKLVIDTNAYSDFMHGHPAVKNHVSQADVIVLPAPVVGELIYGFLGGRKEEENRQQLRRFLRSPVVEFNPTDETVCDRYGLALDQLRRKGHPIPTNDIWIAAHALASGGQLLSSDQHFRFVDGLSWCCPSN